MAILEALPSLLSGVAYTYKGISQYNAPDIDYDILMLQADYKENQANEQELKAEQDANVLRAQFSEAVGTYTYGTARRNVKVGEGSGQENIEMSAKEMGQDVFTLKKNAAFRAEQLRMEAERTRVGAADIKEINKWERTAGLFEGLGKAVGAFDLGIKEWTKGSKPVTKETTTTDTTTKTTETAKVTPKEKTLDIIKAGDVDAGDQVSFNMPEEQIVRPNVASVSPEQIDQAKRYLAEGKDIDYVSTKLKISKKQLSSLIKSGRVG